MFSGFSKHTLHVNGVDIACRTKGSGPALLLLHGHPQTHVIWHKVAPTLAEHFTVVAADLRGYGDSGRPPADEQHSNYSKRSMAADAHELMAALGHPRYCVLAHDRGAIAWRRTTHKRCNVWCCWISRQPWRCTGKPMRRSPAPTGTGFS